MDALLLLARADERGLTPRREDVDLDEVVQAEHRRPSVGIRLRVDACARAAELRAEMAERLPGKILRPMPLREAVSS